MIRNSERFARSMRTKLYEKYIIKAYFWRSGREKKKSKNSKVNIVADKTFSNKHLFQREMPKTAAGRLGKMRSKVEFLSLSKNKTTVTRIGDREVYTEGGGGPLKHSKSR